jgi:hypothetical protein
MGRAKRFGNLLARFSFGFRKICGSRFLGVFAVFSFAAALAPLSFTPFLAALALALPGQELLTQNGVTRTIEEIALASRE